MDGESPCRVARSYVASAGSVPTCTNGAVVGPPKTLSCEIQGAVGWDRLPKQVRNDIAHEVSHLVRAGSAGPMTRALTATNLLTAGSQWPTTRRRSDGTTCQRRSGWWCGSGVLVEVMPTRDLAPREDRRFEPAGDWQVSETCPHQLSDATTKTRRFERHPGGHDEAAPTPLARTDDPLDAISASASDMVSGGSAWIGMLAPRSTSWQQGDRDRGRLRRERQPPCGTSRRAECSVRGRVECCDVECRGHQGRPESVVVVPHRLQWRKEKHQSRRHPSSGARERRAISR
jgi:hypothetical protein